MGRAQTGTRRPPGLQASAGSSVSGAGGGGEKRLAGELDALPQATLLKRFKEADVDGDGQITLAEQARLYQETYGADVSDPRVRAHMQAQFEATDADGSRGISFDEYISAAAKAATNATATAPPDHQIS